MDIAKIRQCGALLPFPGPAAVAMLADEIERLRAELAECREDAERYRWLREHWDDVNHPVDFIICNSFVTTLDADVDAARKGEVET